MFQPPSSETLETDSSGQPSPRQRVASSLQPDEIILDTELRERRRVLEAAAGAIARKHGLDAAPIFARCGAARRSARRHLVKV